MEVVKIEKLVHGGQGIGAMADGRKIFVWNALPGEAAEVRITKKRKDYSEGVAENIIELSPERVEAKDAAYLSTSPWQIMSFVAENKYKKEILTETFEREKVKYNKKIALQSIDQQWHYRNKMEYSFWADETGLHLALFHRGSHGKQIIEGSSIARPEIDATAQKILGVLNSSNIRGSQLKTIVLRSNQDGSTVCGLFVKDNKFPMIKELDGQCQGIEVCYSTPKSPASVLTKSLYKFGDTKLTEKIMTKKIVYDVHSFFQVNIPIFEKVITNLKKHLGDDKKIDLYSGVGTIGVLLGDTDTFIDIDENNCRLAKLNVNKNSKVIQTSSEKALGYIEGDKTLIVDPPRAGLHTKLIDRIIEVLPPKVAYLSCNPSTQARDLAILQKYYTIELIEGYNFFPRTPHIESLAVMIKR